MLGIDATTDSMTGRPLPAPSSVTVSVVNGSGTDRPGRHTSTSLAALGFHMVGASDGTPVGDVAETFVYYGSRAPATEAAAEAVARSMSGAVVMAYDPSQVVGGAEVTVFTGTDFSVNPPAPVPAPAATSGAGLPGIARHDDDGACHDHHDHRTTTTTTSPSVTAAAGAIEAPRPDLGTGPVGPEGLPAGAVPTAPVANET